VWQDVHLVCTLHEFEGLDLENRLSARMHQTNIFGSKGLTFYTCVHVRIHAYALMHFIAFDVCVFVCVCVCVCVCALETPSTDSMTLDFLYDFVSQLMA
jgi:hypothetical protein